MSELADREFWRRYWATRDPVRVIDERFYFSDLLRSVLGGRQGATFVELGGYPGHFSVWVRKHLALEPTLVDSYVDRDSLTELLALNGLPADAIEVVEGDFRTITPPRRFDVVLSAGLVEHFDDTAAVLERHLDFLAPGGTLLVTMPNYLGLNGALQRRYDPEHLAAHNLASMDLERLREVAARLDLASWSIFRFGRFRVWLEDLAERPAAQRLLVYALVALGRPFDALLPKSRLLTPHIALVGRVRS